MKEEEEEAGDPCKDVNYLEPDIDSVRVLKDQVSAVCPTTPCNYQLYLQELERYRKESERKHRELGKQRRNNRTKI